LKINPTIDVKVIQIDMGCPRDVLEFAEEYQDTVDILINNAGISQRDEFVNVCFGVAENMMNVNTLSPIAMIKGILPRMVERRSG